MDLHDILGPALAAALEKKGFERLTPVQEAVLAPDIAGRDLRISSQTGSGKTVAIGFALRRDVIEGAPAEDAAPSREAQPRGLVVTPTRELARQVEEELRWLFAGVPAKVVSVTGGSGIRDELRALRSKPAIVVGTPGRLLDHLKRGAVDGTQIGTIVLDEADRMLDLGFREDVEAILGFAPAERRTHLVSATFSRDVLALANRVQTNALAVEGTPPGAANQDIEHLVHLVEPRDRLSAVVNLLLETPGAPTLIFARTRAGVAELAGALADAGFSVAMLSGEMDQPERNRALESFKRGRVGALVATDVAARGIDVQDVHRVIHGEAPDDPDAYTHRSGRTGRAGKKGLSSLLVTPQELGRVQGLLSRARVRFRFAPVPSADQIRESADDALLTSLGADFVEGEAVDPRSLALAERVLLTSEPARAVARLVALAMRGHQAEPREIAAVAPPTASGHNVRRTRDREQPPSDGWVAFRVSWGSSHGAESRRLVAMLCRRGEIEGRVIGAIRVGRTSSVVEIAAAAAPAFEEAAGKPDPRDPRIHIRRWSEEPTRAPDPRGGDRPLARKPGPPKRRAK